MTADAGNDGFTVMFTNTSEGNFTEQTWTFVHAGEESQNFHEVFTFEAAGTYDVMLEVRNDQCVDIVRKRVVVEGNVTGSNEETLEDVVSGVEEETVFNTNNPVMTSEGWMIDLGTEGEGMTMVAYDLTGRQLCSANGSQRRRTDLHREQPMAQRGVAAFGSRTNEHHAHLENGSIRTCTGR